MARSRPRRSFCRASRSRVFSSSRARSEALPASSCADRLRRATSNSAVSRCCRALELLRFRLRPPPAAHRSRRSARACNSSRPRVRSDSRFNCGNPPSRRRQLGLGAVTGIPALPRAPAPAPAPARIWSGTRSGPGSDRAPAWPPRAPASGTGRRPPAQMRHHFRAQLLVAPRFGRLPLQRIHLPADFFQNVEHARKILPRAFQLRFGQTLARLVFPDARRFLDDGCAGRPACSKESARCGPAR